MLVGAEGDGDSEDEEEIQAWLDNRDWNGMSTLVCRENLEGSKNLNTLQEVFDQERVLTLMDTSDPPTPDILEEDSEGDPTAPLTPASPPPEKDTPAQDSGSSCSAESIKGDVKNLELRCQKLEYEEQVEKGMLKRQLESAIRERRKAEKKYEELLEKLGSPSQINQKTDIPSVTDTSLPELVSTSDSGDGSGEERDTGKHGQGCGKKDKETNLPGI